MTLLERIEADYIASFKERNTERVNVLRLLKSAFKNESIKIESLNYVLSDAEALAVVSREAKQRKDAISQYDAAGRTDLSDKERAELKIIEEFLPESISDEELQALVDAVIAETGATQKADMGRVMGAVKAKLANPADSARAAALISQKLV